MLQQSAQTVNYITVFSTSLEGLEISQLGVRQLSLPKDSSHTKTYTAEMIIYAMDYSNGWLQNVPVPRVKVRFKLADVMQTGNFLL